MSTSTQSVQPTNAKTLPYMVSSDTKMLAGSEYGASLHCLVSLILLYWNTRLWVGRGDYAAVVPSMMRRQRVIYCISVNNNLINYIAASSGQCQHTTIVRAYILWSKTKWGWLSVIMSPNTAVSIVLPNLHQTDLQFQHKFKLPLCWIEIKADKFEFILVICSIMYIINVLIKNHSYQVSTMIGLNPALTDNQV